MGPMNFLHSSKRPENPLKQGEIVTRKVAFSDLGMTIPDLVAAPVSKTGIRVTILAGALASVRVSC